MLISGVENRRLCLRPKVSAETFRKFCHWSRPKRAAISEHIRRAPSSDASNDAWACTDPPFSKMDIISCRNLLIYLDTDTQTKIIPLFNFALNPGGYLFLGKSEGTSSQRNIIERIIHLVRDT
ncbi:MAG: hypothetical protein C4560_09100 [Nitrospiraceae bacterium]|nr:MAG: hypothetical protein C4560_09100 [Nitrospiraceae bacterium]